MPNASWPRCWTRATAADGSSRTIAPRPTGAWPAPSSTLPEPTRAQFDHAPALRPGLSACQTTSTPQEETVNTRPAPAPAMANGATVTMPGSAGPTMFDPASVALAGVILAVGLLTSFTHVRDVAHAHGWSGPT